MARGEEEEIFLTIDEAALVDKIDLTTLLTGISPSGDLYSLSAEQLINTVIDGIIWPEPEPPKSLVIGDFVCGNFPSHDFEEEGATYLFCDGRDVLEEEYPELFKLMPKLPIGTLKGVLMRGADSSTDLEVGKEWVSQVPDHNHNLASSPAGNHIHSANVLTSWHVGPDLQNGSHNRLRSRPVEKAVNFNNDGEHTHTVILDTVGTEDKLTPPSYISRLFVRAL